MPRMMVESVRRPLYVLYARLLATPPDAELYRRLHAEGLRNLAELQGLDLFGDLPGPEDAEGAAAQLEIELERLRENVYFEASDYGGGAEDPAASIDGFMREHGLELNTPVELERDDLAVVLGLMGELVGQAEAKPTTDRQERARAFFQRHIEPWAQRALAEIATAARLRFYRGLASLISSFLANERRTYLPDQQ